MALRLLTSDSEFSSEELSALIEDALDNKGTQEHADVGEVPVAKPTSALFGLGDTHLLRSLWDILGEFLAKEDIPLVMDKLRAELYAGINLQDLQSVHSVAKNIKTVSGGQVQMPLWNNSNPDIVFISEKAVTEFRDDENMFVKELKDAGFSSSVCAWTYLVRYSIRDLKDVPPEEMARWESILFSELRAWKPKLIIPIGKVVTELLIGENVKMSEINGTHMWVGPWQIMPMASYSYLLKGNKVAQLKSALDSAYSICFGTFGKI